MPVSPTSKADILPLATEAMDQFPIVSPTLKADSLPLHHKGDGSISNCVSYFEGRHLTTSPQRWWINFKLSPTLKADILPLHHKGDGSISNCVSYFEGRHLTTSYRGGGSISNCVSYFEGRHLTTSPQRWWINFKLCLLLWRQTSYHFTTKVMDQFQIVSPTSKADILPLATEVMDQFPVVSPTLKADSLPLHHKGDGSISNCVSYFEGRHLTTSPQRWWINFQLCLLLWRQTAYHFTTKVMDQFPVVSPTLKADSLPLHHKGDGSISNCVSYFEGRHLTTSHRGGGSVSNSHASPFSTHWDFLSFSRSILLSWFFSGQLKCEGSFSIS